MRFELRHVRHKEQEGGAIMNGTRPAVQVVTAGVFGRDRFSAFLEG